MSKIKQQWIDIWSIDLIFFMIIIFLWPNPDVVLTDINDPLCTKIIVHVHIAALGACTNWHAYNRNIFIHSNDIISILRISIYVMSSWTLFMFFSRVFFFRNMGLKNKLKNTYTVGCIVSLIFLYASKDADPTVCIIKETNKESCRLPPEGNCLGEKGVLKWGQRVTAYEKKKIWSLWFHLSLH